MFTRRSAIVGAACLVAKPAFAAQPQEKSQAFDSLLDATLSQENTLDEVRGDREGKAFDDIYTRALGPRFKPEFKVKISDRANRLIVGFEITNQALYQARYQHPVWPQGRSGVTIGIGYDLGYADPSWVADDWSGILTPSQIAKLQTACLIRGPAAGPVAQHLTAVRIPWHQAKLQFDTSTLPRFIALVLDVLPNAKMLKSDQLGAIVSLVYNRGASFEGTTDRYREMREIRLAMVREEFQEIPQYIRKMTRLWSPTSGLRSRRELEARLFELDL